MGLLHCQFEADKAEKREKISIQQKGNWAMIACCSARWVMCIYISTMAR